MRPNISLGQVQEISIHVPDRGGRHDMSKGWMPATEINMAPPIPVYNPAVDAVLEPAEAVEETTEEATKGLLNVLNETWNEVTGMESNISTAVTLSQTDAENRVHVAALINAVAAKQAELKALFQAEELTAEPDDVKRIQQELTEVSRLRSVLETHLNTLAAEASGEKELENISRYPLCQPKFRGLSHIYPNTVTCMRPLDSPMPSLGSPHRIVSVAGLKRARSASWPRR